MYLCELEGTYVHHLSKPENMAVLEAYKKDKDKSVEKLAKLDLWLIDTLRPTKAWGKPKTNMMINNVIAHTKATISGAKKGKTSAFAVAGILINKVNFCRTKEASPSHPYNPGLPADFADFEEQLKAIAAI